MQGRSFVGLHCQMTGVDHQRPFADNLLPVGCASDTANQPGPKVIGDFCVPLLPRRQQEFVLATQVDNRFKAVGLGQTPE